MARGEECVTRPPERQKSGLTRPTMRCGASLHGPQGSVHGSGTEQPAGRKMAGQDKHEAERKRRPADNLVNGAFRPCLVVFTEHTRSGYPEHVDENCRRNREQSDARPKPQPAFKKVTVDETKEHERDQ